MGKTTVSCEFAINLVIWPVYFTTFQISWNCGVLRYKLVHCEIQYEKLHFVDFFLYGFSFSQVEGKFDDFHRSSCSMKFSATESWCYVKSRHFSYQPYICMYTCTIEYYYNTRSLIYMNIVHYITSFYEQAINVNRVRFNEKRATLEWRRIASNGYAYITSGWWGEFFPPNIN